MDKLRFIQNPSKLIKIEVVSSWDYYICPWMVWNRVTEIQRRKRRRWEKMEQQVWNVCETQKDHKNSRFKMVALLHSRSITIDNSSNPIPQIMKKKKEKYLQAILLKLQTHFIICTFSIPRKFGFLLDFRFES